MSDSISEQRPYTELIVICGPPRSGTTWLTRQLCSLSTAFPFLPECSLITQQIGLYVRTLSYEYTRFHAYFSNEQNLLSFYRKGIAELVDLVANLNQKTGASTLILKDPMLCLYLENAKSLLPAHKLIVLVRDPRDVVASWKNVASRKKQKWNVAATANEVLSYYNQIKMHQEHAYQDSIFVRYEDLVIGQTSLLQKFLQLGNENLAFSDADISVVREKTNFLDPCFSELYLKETTSEKIGSYTKSLPKNEVEYIEGIFSSVMQHWGYVPHQVKTGCSA